MVRVDRQRRTRRSEGYNLVALMVAVAVVNIGIAAALPVWSKVVQRDNEKELIFRGLQYAEAIRVFQKRNGRFPIRLEELIEIEPRSIRQLWRDPLNDEPEWGLILAQGTPAAQSGVSGQKPQPGSLGDDRRQRRRRDRDRRTGRDGAAEVSPRQRIEDPSGRRRSIPRAGEQVTRGPIIGVHSLSDEEAVQTFLGSQNPKDWKFTVELIPQIEAAAGVDSVPRLHSNWIGRSFPAGVEASEDPAATDNPLDRDRDRNRRRSRRKRN